MKRISHHSRLSWLLASLLFLPVLVSGQAIPVTVGMNSEGQWQLYRNGEPYYINGVGGTDHLDLAAACGANSFRTWSPDDAGELLDEAQRLGMTVMLGLWVQHERHGFDYDNEAKVKAQLDYFTEVVKTYKDHPALLLWGVGNEVDLFYSNTKVWNAIEDIAAMIHQIDPNHPTSTVTAGLDPAEVRLIMANAPSIDIYGINTYGDIGIVPDTIRSAGWQGPYIISEWGPNGHWEVSKTKWNAPVEQSSSEKAASYKARYNNYIAGDRVKCVGSYVFLWGQKQETTSTWYGLLSEDGRQSEAIDELIRAWTGKEPANRAPAIASASLNGQSKGADIILQPGQPCQALATVTDADGDQMKFIWEVVSESQDIKAGGDAESRPPSVKGLGMRKDSQQVSFRAPQSEGAYRLFLYVYDAANHYAYLNIPFYVLPDPSGEQYQKAIQLREQSL